MTDSLQLRKGKYKGWILLSVMILGMLIMLSQAFAIVEITTNDSNIRLSNLTYTLDIPALGVVDTSVEYHDPSSNSTTMTNTLHTIDYTCLLNIFDGASLNATYISSALAPALTGKVTVIEMTPQEFGDGRYMLGLSCSLSIIAQTNTTSSAYIYNETTNTTENVISEWISENISVSNYTVSKTIVVDSKSPSLILNSPINATYIKDAIINTTNTSLNITQNSSILYIPDMHLSKDVLLNFSLDDRNALACTIDLDNKTISLKDLSAGQVVHAVTVEEYVNLSLPLANLSSYDVQYNRTYPYTIRCVDPLGNNNISSSTFYVRHNVSILTNHSVQAAVEQPSLSIQLSKTSFDIGEIGQYALHANNGSNVSMTICPISTGWVQCYTVLPFINESYPKYQSLPYTNKTGQYLIDATMRYKNSTLRYNITYAVINSMDVSITKSKSTAAVNEIITFNATATGGVAPYGYKWIMHDNSVYTGSGAYKNFTTPGAFTEKLIVNDSYGNQYNATVEVRIKPIYRLKVLTYDDAGKKMGDVNVTINDDLSKKTSSSGEVAFDLVEGEYEIEAFKGNYFAYEDELDLDTNLTVNMTLSIEDNIPPKITLLTSNNVTFTPDAVKLRFKADDITKLSCSLYIAEANTSWFVLKDAGDDLSVNTEYTFEMTDLVEGSYKWKIECKDDNKNANTAPERIFNVMSLKSMQELDKKENSASQINSALDSLSSLSGAEAEVVDALGIKEDLKELLERYATLERDLQNVQFRRDLDEAGKQAWSKNLTESLEYTRYNTPVDIEVVEAKTFVKYIKDEDLKILLAEYKAIKNLNLNDKDFLAYTKSIQSKAIISTKARIVRLHYLDGKTKDVTVITKDIQIAKDDDANLFANSRTMTFVEVIPKTVAKSADEISVLNDEYTVVKDDPILEFPSTARSISYSIEKKISLENLEAIDTVIMDKNIKKLDSVTGFAIVPGTLADIQFDGKTILSIVVAVLLIVYIMFSFGVLDRLKNLYYAIFSKKKITYIRVLINDSSDYIAAGDYEKASLIYREVKLSYESSPAYIRKKLYDDCYDLCNRLDVQYFKDLALRIDDDIKTGSNDMLATDYDKLEKTYNKIDEKYRKDISSMFERMDRLFKQLKDRHA